MPSKTPTTPSASQSELIVRNVELIDPTPLATATVDGITVGQLVEIFLRSKRSLLATREISIRMIEWYDESCRRLIRFCGHDASVAAFRAAHFTMLREAMPATWGVHRRAGFIQNIRTLLKFAYDSELIDRPIRFGDFKKPKLSAFRRERRERGVKMLEAAEIRAVLDVINRRRRNPKFFWAMRAFVLLGINCGFGPSDCGRLRKSDVDLKNGIIDFPRPKTESDRRCVLWPETVDAIERYLQVRPAPNRPELSDLVFVTKYGNQWANGETATPITKGIKKILREAGVYKPFRVHYGLRRSFRTIADETGDQPAANYIMGHCDKSNDMAATYRQRIGDDRLRKVVEHVRAWLFPGNPLDWDDPNNQKVAKRIGLAWDVKPNLEGHDVAEAIESLGITQHELARGTGINSQWLSVVILGKVPMSSETELRVRLYLQQLSEGKTPKPLTAAELRPDCGPADVPLSQAAIELLACDPMSPAALDAVGECLAMVGIGKAKLCDWLAPLKYRFWWDMQSGRKAIPANFAERLRKLFGVKAAKGGAA